MAQTHAEGFGKNPRIGKDQGTYLWDELIYVPTELREELIREHHEEPAHGHQGIDRTVEKISRDWYFPKMRSTIKKIVQECEVCTKAKTARDAPYGKLQSIKPPIRAWEEIAFDHITKLPRSEDPTTGTIYDSIWVVTDRLTKYAHFVPYKEESTAEDLAYTYLREVACQRGSPRSVITDRGTTFTSKFWASFMAQLGTKHKMSTAYHPQTDRETERLNQTLEQYLRCYLNYQQDNWVTLLLLV